MLCREHHHPGRVAQPASVVARLRHRAHAAVHDQPAVRGEDGRRAAADFEPLPRRHRSGQPVMRGKVTQMPWLAALDGHGAVGNPDAFPIEISYAGCRVACLFLWTRAGKERPVQERQRRLSRGIRNSDREDAGVLIVNAVERNAVIRLEGGQAQSPPVEQIIRFRYGESRAMRQKRRVRHHVLLKRFDERDPRSSQPSWPVPPSCRCFRGDSTHGTSGCQDAAGQSRIGCAARSVRRSVVDGAPSRGTGDRRDKGTGTEAGPSREHPEGPRRAGLATPDEVVAAVDAGLRPTLVHMAP